MLVSKHYNLCVRFSTLFYERDVHKGGNNGELTALNAVSIFQEEKEALDEILAKRNKKGKQVEEKSMEEKTTLHSKFTEFRVEMEHPERICC